MKAIPIEILNCKKCTPWHMCTGHQIEEDKRLNGPININALVVKLSGYLHRFTPQERQFIVNALSSYKGA